MKTTQKLSNAVLLSLQAVEQGSRASEQYNSLLPLFAEWDAYIAALEARPDIDKARAQYISNKQVERAEQPFLLSWAGGGSTQVIGWEALAKEIKLKESSIRVHLSQGKGTFNLHRTNPLVGERDILTVTRLALPGELVEKAPVGRPPKQAYDLDVLGSEAPRPKKLSSPTPKSRRNNKIPTDDPNSP